MSTELVTKVEVFLVPKISNSLPSAGLFEDDRNVIVFFESGCSNDFPRHYNWRIQYIGPVSEFSEVYVERMAEMIDDGISRLTQGTSTGSAFRKKMTRLLSEAIEITPPMMHRKGFYGYSWSDEDAAHITSTSHLVQHQLYGNDRYAGQIIDENDLVCMFEAAMDIKAASDEPRLWFSGLHKLSAGEFHRFKERAAA